MYFFLIQKLAWFSFSSYSMKLKQRIFSHGVCTADVSVLLFVVGPARRSATNRRWSSAAVPRSTETVCRPSCLHWVAPSSGECCAARSAPSCTAWSSAWRRRCCPSSPPPLNTCWRTVRPRTCKSSSHSSARSPPSSRYERERRGGGNWGN